MKRIAWMTDIHLEFLKPWEIDTFHDLVLAQQPDALLLTGDIAQAAMLRSALVQMARHVKVPVYFVLGNHDYYNDDIPTVRQAMTKLHHDNVGPVWLPEAGVVELAPGIGLVGHGGWADGRYGHFMLAPVFLNDYLLIESLRTPSEEERWKRLKALGDEGAGYYREILPQAAKRYQKVFALMHAPPFMEACWHRGKLPDEDDPFLPHFTCKAIGDVLLEIAAKYSQTEFTVLCGHTHGGGSAQIKDNLLVLTGAAEYGNPAINQIFELET